MKTTHEVIARGLAKRAQTLDKTAMLKTAARRWLEDADLVKLCRLFQAKQPKKSR